MELQNIPTKLVNKFKKANIRTVEDLQNNYNRLINGLGFGGIFVAALLDYMQREGIKLPEGAMTQRKDEPRTKKEFSFSPPPSKLLTKAFIKANIYSIEDLQKNFKELTKAEYFGNKRIDELVKYMKVLGIKDIPESLKAKHLASIQSQFAIIKKDVDELVACKKTKFLFPCNAALSIAFAKLHINNMKDLQKKLQDLQEVLRSKHVAISELRTWIQDTKEYYKNNESERKQNVLSIYLKGLKTIAPGESIRKIRYTQKIAAYLVGKNIAGMPRVDGQAMVQLNNARELVQKHSFLAANEILRQFSTNIKEITDEERLVSRLLCRAAGYKIPDLKRYGQKKGFDMFVTKNSAIAHLIKDVADEAYEILQAEVIPTDITKISKALAKRGFKKLDEEKLAHLLSNLSYIERNGKLYSIPIEKLKSKSDIAERILYTLDKRISTDELCARVNKVLKQKNKPTNTETQRSATNFMKNENIVFHIKTGEWSFKKQKLANATN